MAERSSFSDDRQVDIVETEEGGWYPGGAAERGENLYYTP